MRKRIIASLNKADARQLLIIYYFIVELLR